MKKTLLEIVQDIMNDMDSDDVNSINDTIESQQVANIVKQTYQEIISNRNWPHLKKLIQLDASTDPNKPTHMKLPEELKELEYIKYDKSTAANTDLKMETVKFLYPDEFLRFTEQRKSSNSNILTVTDFSGTKILIVTDKAPSYWTSFDDEYIVFDSYQADIETTLMKSKTQCYAVMQPVWVHEDSAVPDLPSEAFAFLTEEAKSTASNALKQMANQKAEQKSQRQARWLSRKKWQTNGGVRYQNFGRRSTK